jgi:hypothetical protein
MPADPPAQATAAPAAAGPDPAPPVVEVPPPAVAPGNPSPEATGSTPPPILAGEAEPPAAPDPAPILAAHAELEAALAEIREAMQATPPPDGMPPLELPVLPALPDWSFL